MLPVFVLGLVLSSSFAGQHDLQRKLRVIAFGIVTPFFFLKGGLNVSLGALGSSLALVAILFLLKIVAKSLGVFPLALKYLPGQATYTTLLMSTAYHPQTDGQTENSNKTLETVLRSVVNFEQSDWDTHLTAAELAVNSSKNATTGYSPFFLSHGFEPRLPIDAAIAPLPRPAASNATATEMHARWRAALASAQTNILKAQQRQAHYANQHRREVTFAVGDRVLLVRAAALRKNDA